MGDKRQPASLRNSKSEISPEDITFSEGGVWKRRTKLEKGLIVLAVLLLITTILFLVLFIVFKGVDDTVEEDTCNTFDCLETAAYVAQSINSSVDPCEDFYQFACGRWIERNPLTPAKPSVDQISMINEDVQKSLRDLLSADDPNALEAIKKTRTFFKSCEDINAMNARGVKPLLDLLNDGGSNLFPTLDPNWVDKNLTLNQILALVGQVGNLSMSPLIGLKVAADSKQSRNNIIVFTQPKLSLSSRDYFLGARDSNTLVLYQQLYVDLMTSLGANASVAAQDAVDMVDFEILVANATMPAELRRDAEKLYNKMTVRNLTMRYPQFDWLEYLQNIFSPEGIDVTMDEEVVVNAVDYYDKVFQAVDSTSQRAVLNYCLWKFVYPFASMLDSTVREMKDKFSRALTGAQRTEERWKQCVSTTDSLFYAVSGRLYVEKHFSPQAKSKMDIMIADLKDAFREMLRASDWMSKQTKQAALEKVDANVNQVGYPVADMNNTLLNQKLENLIVEEKEFFENNMNINRFNFKKSIRKLRQPVDREEWHSSAALVNAFYNPYSNAIFFPAGILHRPFFSDQFMDALNYGGIGMVIGHEITHGFDDSGRAFDKEGNLNMWWQQADLDRFTARAQCIVDQYSSFIEPVVNKPVNGRLTLGEDIADNGGLKEAYLAFRNMVAKRGQKELKLPVLKYTPDQLFFISNAQVTCSNLSKQLRDLYLKIDYHSPDRFRAIGPMQNSEEFAKVFNCPVGSYMNPKKKCHVW